jgi:hypothetical protein
MLGRGGQACQPVACRLSCAGKHPDASGKHHDASGKHHDASGKHPDASGKHPDASGKHHDASGKHHDASGKHHDASGKHHDASGKHPDASGKHPDASGKHPDASGKHPDASGKHPDASGKQLAASRPAKRGKAGRQHCGSTLGELQLAIDSWLSARLGRSRSAARQMAASRRCRNGHSSALRACGKTRVFRDDLASQPAVSSRLRGALTSLNCEIRRLRPAAPRGSKGIDVREMLRHCRAGLTLAPFLSPYEILYCQVLVFSHRRHSLRLGSWQDAEKQKKHGVAFSRVPYACGADRQRVIARHVTHSQAKERFYCFGKERSKNKLRN